MRGESVLIELLNNQIRNEPESESKSCLRSEPDIARVVEMEERGMRQSLRMLQVLTFVFHIYAHNVYAQTMCIHTMCVYTNNVHTQMCMHTHAHCSRPPGECEPPPTPSSDQKKSNHMFCFLQ